ncbi:MAG: M1 family aminopeptidase [Gammaproteobacteria bacterium]|nr:M1 family aminopeptidase [Gammaproteobacteria bacterium]
MGKRDSNGMGGAATPHRVWWLAGWLLWAATVGAAESAPEVAHRLQVTLDPATGSIAVVDQVTLGNLSRKTPPFALHRAFRPRTNRGRVTELRRSGDDLLRHYRIAFDRPSREVEIRYQGRLGVAAERTMGGMPRATVEPEGVYLDGSSAWYPRFEGPITAFTLEVDAPAGWQTVSQGRRNAKAGRSVWHSTTPQDDIYLIAGPFNHHRESHGDIDLEVLLLEDDPRLAARYLAVMGGYIDIYSELIGPYPYPKFAVVENRWETGFGMPSFTLLGSRVMRLPFIPYTSLPHEILHNWWGNGVWVDYAAGNWSEGLTAYLSDHLMKEFRGEGARHRLAALERYANFAAAGRDFPLIRFVSRHDDASQAVGYGKGLMVFHMVRRDLGDEAFTTGLRRLWRERRFRPTGFEEALSLLAGDGRQRDYSPWLTRTGAPVLTLGEVTLDETPDGFELTLTVRQAQDGPPFGFMLPVALSYDGDGAAELRNVPIADRETTVAWTLERRPTRLDVDPAYDVMRLLDPRERPPSLGLLFGSPAQWLVIPEHADATTREAWQGLAAHWQRRYGNVVVKTDAGDLAPPEDAAVWILGWQNRALEGRRDAFAGADQGLEPDAARAVNTRHLAGAKAVVLLAPDIHRHRMGFIGAESPGAIAALARKLPHYGGYGRLVFEESGGANLAKERMAALDPPFTRQLSPDPVPLRLPHRPPLAANPFAPEEEAPSYVGPGTR